MGDADKVMQAALKASVNLRQIDSSSVSIALDETTMVEDVDTLFSVLNGGSKPDFDALTLADQVRHCNPCKYMFANVYSVLMLCGTEHTVPPSLHGPVRLSNIAACVKPYVLLRMLCCIQDTVEANLGLLHHQPD